MQTSMFLARLIGPVLLVMGVAMLLDRRAWRAMAEEFLGSPALIFLAGLLALVPGLAVVLTHNVWSLDWRLIVTLLGWLAVLGGVFRILLPRQVTRIGSAMLASDGAMTAAALVMLLLGGVLGLAGYLG
ncbi:MAG TPA: hypothetical protein VFG43_00520 [Geminicoccaceae bacterium]|nr:hypothetical protein [Geminicoccaceae bacterium]